MWLKLQVLAKEAARIQKGRGRGQQRREKSNAKLSVQGQVTESGKTTVLSGETHARTHAAEGMRCRWLVLREGFWSVRMKRVEEKQTRQIKVR